MACDPKTLVSNAVCLECNIPVGSLLPIIISLAAQTVGASSDPQILLSNATALQSIPTGARWPVIIALACQIAGV